MKKRVLFVSHDAGLYGAQQSLLSLVLGLSCDYFEPYVVVPRAGLLSVALESRGIPVFTREIKHWITTPEKRGECKFVELLRRMRGLRGRAWAIAKLIEKLGIDVVYTNTITVLEGAVAARQTRKPHVWHAREQVKGNKQLCFPMPGNLIPYIMAYLSERIIVNSDYLRCTYALPAIKRKVKTVHNGIDVDEYAIDKAAAREDVRRELNVPSDSKLVVSIGTITPRKGQLLLLNAITHVLKRIDQVVVLLVGDGDDHYHSELREFIAANGLDGTVRMVGWRTDVKEILASADVMVVAAEEEPFGRTVIEAMAVGVPIVSTKCGGPEEILAGGVGRLVEKGDAKALGQHICDVLLDIDIAENMVERGLERAVMMYGVDAYVSRVGKVITESMEGYGG